MKTNDIRHTNGLRRALVRRLLLLLLLLTAGAGGAWGQNDHYAVTGSETLTPGTTICSGTYTSLTLGFTGDTDNTFSYESSDKRIDGSQNPSPKSGVPTKGCVYVFTANRSGTFTFKVRLNGSKSMYLRNSSGVDLYTKANSGEAAVYNWTVNVETSTTATYYLFAGGSKLSFYEYTFTPKPIQGITELPYSADFTADTEPFDGGTRNTGNGDIHEVFTVSNATATARFNGVYTPKLHETVTLSFTAYHGYLGGGGGSTVTLFNSKNQPLVSYTYSQANGQITDVQVGGTTPETFGSFSGASNYNGTQMANGFIGNGKPYKSGSGTYNPVITFTVSGDGTVSFSLKRSNQSIERTYAAILEDVVMDLDHITIEDRNSNDDRSIGVDDLHITSQFYSYDYENTGGQTDWISNKGGRFTPTIMEEASGNHYMGVNQDQRNNNGATLTNSNISGAAAAGENFTLTFDMKLGSSNNHNTEFPYFIIKDLSGATILKLAATAKNGTSWKLNDSSTDIPLSGTNTNTLDNLTWYSVKVSKIAGKLYLTITDRDTKTCVYRTGINNTANQGLGVMEFHTGRYWANFAIDNLNVFAYANTHFTQSGKTETYTIDSEGDLPQTDQGKTFSVEYGDAWQGQQTSSANGVIAAYGLANTTGIYTPAWATDDATPSNVLPSSGTFYVIKPKFDGTLSVSGWVDKLNNVTLQKESDKTVVATIASGTLTANTPFSNQSLGSVTAGETYYLYANTPKTVNGDGSDNEATLFLTGLTFTQTNMNREIAVDDLLYAAGKTTSDGLNRTIPGFTLQFTGNVQTVSAGDGSTLLKFTSESGSDGTLKLKLRQNGYEAKIQMLKFAVDNASDGAKMTIGGTEYTPGTQVTLGTSDEVTIACTTGNFSISAITVGYEGDDPLNIATWLEEEKGETGISVADAHVVRVPGDNRDITNTVTFTSPASFQSPLSYSSSDTRIVTIEQDGTNGRQIASGAATVTVAFSGTDYFSPSQATFTVSNTLAPGEHYDCTVTSGEAMKVTALADADDVTLSLEGGITDATSLTQGITSNKQQVKATSAGAVVLKNNTPTNNITLERVSIFTSNVVAWLYYDGQEENYRQQMQFQNFATGPVSHFRVLDIGDTVDPEDLTDSYEWTSESTYTASDTHGILTGFNSTTGACTPVISDAVKTSNATAIENGTFSYPTISRLLTKKAEQAVGYPDNITATNTVYVQLPPDEDTYKVWDFCATVTGRGELEESRWTWNRHNYYQTSLSSYLPILNSSNPSQPVLGNEGILAYGEMRYYAGSNGLRLNLTQVNSHLKFPVKKDMEVKVVLACASSDVTNIITNALDIESGNSVNSLYVENEGENNNVTAYYRVAADGCMEIHAMDKLGTYIKSITLQRPRLHFSADVYTENAGTESSTVSYPLINASEGANLTYTIRDSKNNKFDGTDGGAGYVATVDGSTGELTLAGENHEGWVTVDVVDNNATGVQPKKGSCEVYLVDFRFDPSSAVLEDLSASKTEVTYSTRPLGIDKVKTPIRYSLTLLPDATLSPRGRLVQQTAVDPALTTYEMSAYSPGSYLVTATSGNATTSCQLTVCGYAFAQVTPVMTPEQVTTSSGEFYNELPDGFTATSVTVDLTEGVTCTEGSIEDGKVRLVGLSGHGAIRVNATDGSGNTLHFVLTLSYPASSMKRWNFYQTKHYTHDAQTDYGLYLGHIADYDDNENQTVEGLTVNGHGTSWTTVTNWKKIYRKGEEFPRWAYSASVLGNNAFIIEETAGLLIETSKYGLYTDNPHQPTEEAYNHIGLHNNASVTIPGLKAGDYIALNMSRVIPNNGAIIKATNVTDLSGTSVTESFTITRSQTDYRENGVIATESDGSRKIPGLYTFRAKADGDVTFTLSDEGYLDLLSIEIYDEDKSRSNSDPDNGYLYTMLPLKLEDLSAPRTIILKEKDEDAEPMQLTYCNQLQSTSVGPASYEIVSKNSNLEASVSKVDWYSPRGAYYEKGRIDVGSGYGKLTIRMNNYTADGKYLIGYTPDYTLTVGIIPHQQYPYTWNFTNIGGGQSKQKSNNAYNSMKADGVTWKALGYNMFELNTSTTDGSFYVPGATLVSSVRNLGAKGTRDQLTTAGDCCDEFNGLGFTGSIALKTASQTAGDDKEPDTDVDADLLTYTIPVNADAFKTETFLTAGDGEICFGAPKREETSSGSGVYAYRLDGNASVTSSKYFILKPQRAFRNGDVITAEVYSNAVTNATDYGLAFYESRETSGTVLSKMLMPKGLAIKTPVTLTHTVTPGDGLAGLTQVYVFRVSKTLFMKNVQVTGSNSTKIDYKCKLKTKGEVTITVPDVTATPNQDWIYVKSSTAPTVVTNATLATAADGQDAASRVFKYKVSNNGNCLLTFADGTEIERIGVTHILKPISVVGNEGWATESRDVPIDHSLTGLFTVNDVNAYTVSVKSSGANRVTVQLDAVNSDPDDPDVDDDVEQNANVGVPAYTGLVLRQNDKSNLTLANAGGVPLFAPAMTTPVLTTAEAGFLGTRGNRMKDCVAGINNIEETENISGTDYTRFILAKRFLTWRQTTTKVGAADATTVKTHSSAFDTSSEVAAFYRLHKFKGGFDGETVEQLNTLGANKACLLLNTYNLPEALWKPDDPSPSRQYVGILGISDMYEEELECEAPADDRTYDLRGRVVDDAHLQPGVYIRGGRKIVVR